MLKTLFPVYFVIFIGFVGYSLMITVFTPLFLHLDIPILDPNSSTSTRTIWLGIVLFLYPFGQFLSSPIVGALSDKFGRKPILAISLLSGIICYAIIALSLQFANLTLLCIFLFLAGISEGNVTLAQGTIADLTKAKERGRYFGYIYFSASLAYIIGPLVGGKLADRTLVSWFSYDLPFWVISVLLILNFFWVMFALQETHARNKQEKIDFFEAFSNIKNIFTAKKLRYLFAINFLIYLAIFGFFRSYPMYIVDEFKVGVSKLSELIAWVAVPIIVVNLWLYGLFSRRYHPLELTIGSAFLVGIFTIFIIVPSAFNALWVTLFFAALAIAFCLPSCATLLSINANKNEQGSVMGNNQSLQYFAESFSGLVAGFLAAILVKFPLIIFGICSILAGLLLLPIWWGKMKSARNS